MQQKQQLPVNTARDKAAEQSVSSFSYTPVIQIRLFYHLQRRYATVNSLQPNEKEILHACETWSISSVFYSSTSSPITISGFSFFPALSCNCSSTCLSCSGTGSPRWAAFSRMERPLLAIAQKMTAVRRTPGWFSTWTSSTWAIPTSRKVSTFRQRPRKPTAELSFRSSIAHITPVM